LEVLKTKDLLDETSAKTLQNTVFVQKCGFWRT